MNVVILFDGLCEPRNPGGHGAWGYVMWINSEKYYHRGYLGQNESMTNNYAEWCALGFALKGLYDQIGNQKIDSLTILGDSQLVINQFNYNWKCKKERMRNLRSRCEKILESLNVVDLSIRWIPRELNDPADAMSREAYNFYVVNK